MCAIRSRNRWITIHKDCWNTTGNAKNVMETVWFAANQTILHHKRKILPNQLLQAAANLLRGLSAAEPGRCRFESFLASGRRAARGPPNRRDIPPAGGHGRSPPPPEQPPSNARNSMRCAPKSRKDFPHLPLAQTAARQSRVSAASHTTTESHCVVRGEACVIGPSPVRTRARAGRREGSIRPTGHGSSPG